jgi:uncharacterized protein with von Willebrand factor type A (vWA) domain
VLFDSSGSVTGPQRTLAVGCAQQYAQAAIRDGARVAVANFADRVEFTEPTTDMADVNAALRGQTSGRGTRLPAAELKPILDAHQTEATDLVVVSDGYIPNAAESLRWYRYFLDSNTDNRAYMMVVGAGGHPSVRHAFRQAGFDVYAFNTL